MSTKLLLFFILLTTPVSFQSFNFSNNIQTIAKNLFNKTIIENFPTKNLTLLKDSSKTILEEFVQFVAKFWVESKIMSSKIFIDSRTLTCLKSLYDIMGNIEEIGPFFRGSGKALNDLGNEFECENNISKYLSIHFFLENSSYLSNDEDQPLMDFIDQHYFYVGLCLPSDCKEANKLILSIKENKELLDYFYYHFTMSNMTVYYVDDQHLDTERNLFFEILIIIFVIYLFIKIIIGIFRISLIDKGYEGYYNKIHEKLSFKQLPNNIFQHDDLIDNSENDNKLKLVDNKNLSNLFEKFNNENKVYNKLIYGSSRVEELNLYNPFCDNEDKYPFWLKFVKLMDFFDGINLLSSLTNKYYNSYYIKRIYILRFAIMMMCIIFKLMYCQIELPTKNFLTYNFYTDYKFIFIKFCINASTFWITIDAVIIGFKLMSYIKKEKHISKKRKLTFLSLLKFLLLVIPKFFVFFLAFVFLHIFSDNVTYQLGKFNKILSPYFYYREINKNNTFSARFTKKNLTISILKNFVPFRLNYIDYIYKSNSNESIRILYEGNGSNNSNLAPNYTYYDFDKTDYKIPSPFLTNTELFVNIYFNEFYLLIIILIITYLSYLLKSRIFDIIILIANIILFFIPLLRLINPDFGDKYTLKYVLGQNYTEKYTHYFVNFFYFGFLIGVMLFYQQEIQNSNRSMSQKFTSSITLNTSNSALLLEPEIDNMYPFSFCKIIINNIGKLKFWIKRTLCLLSLLCLFFISASFNILQITEEKNRNENNNEKSIYTLEIKDNNLIKFIFIFEKNISGLFFFVFLLMFITYPKNTNIIQLADLKTFIIIERISFCFFCSFNYLIYAEFCVFIVQFKITYLNVALNAIGMFLLIFIFSLSCNIIFELPLRILIKSLMNKNLVHRIKVYCSELKINEKENEQDDDPVNTK